MRALFLAALLFLAPVASFAQQAVQSVNGMTPDSNGNVTISLPVVMGSPNGRTFVVSTAYQASVPAKAATFIINMSSTANLSLTGGTTNMATVYIGPTNGVATGTGTPVCTYTNGNTGALTIGLALAQTMAGSCAVAVPAGWYIAIVPNSGSVTISSAFDQSVG